MKHQLPLLDIDLISEDRVSTLTIKGEIDLSNVKGLIELLEEVLPNELVSVVIDMNGVEYIDSAGLNFLFTLNRRLATRNQLLFIIAEEGHILHQLFALINMSKMIAIYPSMAEVPLKK